MLDIPSREITKSKMTVSAAQDKKWIGVVSVAFKSGHRRMIAEAFDTISSVFDSFAYLPDPASNAPLGENEIIEADWPGDLRDSTSTGDRGPCSLPQIQEISRPYGLSAPLMYGQFKV